jgi:hypothetical protein
MKCSAVKEKYYIGFSGTVVWGIVHENLLQKTGLFT